MDQSISKTKVCFGCGDELDLNMFYKNKAMKDGYINKCKKCTLKDRQKYRDKPRVKRKEVKRTKQRTANGEWKERYWEKKKSGGNRT